MTKNLNDDVFSSNFKNDRERIAYNTKQFANMTCEEALLASRDDDATKSKPTRVSSNDIMLSSIKNVENLRVGQYIVARLQSVSHRKTVFETPAITDKEIVSSISFDAYPAFIDTCYGDDKLYTLRIERIEGTRIVVDPASAVYGTWLSRVTSFVAQHSTDLDVLNAVVRVTLDKLVKGGFIGRAYIEPLSKAYGVPVYMPCFVPGSQIVLNIERDFERWVGETIECYVEKLSKDNRNNDMLICSRKRMLRHIGELNKLVLAQDLDTENPTTSFDGIITGVINSRTNCGVFVEIPELSMTGLLRVDDERTLVDYEPETHVRVRITSIDINNDNCVIMHDDTTNVAYIKSSNINVEYEIA